MSLPSGIEQAVAEVDYRRKVQEIPMYKHSKLLPLSGSQSTTVTSSGGQEVIFELGASECHNLSRSVLRFTATPAAGGASTYNWTWAHTPGIIREIHLVSRGGVYVVQARNLPRWLNVARFYCKPVDDIMNNDNSSGAEGLLVVDDSDGTGAKCKSPTSDTAPAARAYNLAIRYNEIGGSNTATPVISFAIPMSELVSTLFEQNKDIYFGQVMQVKVVFNSSSASIWASASATNPTSSAAAYTGNIAITNLAFYDAIQTNQNLKNSLITATLASGVSLLYDNYFDFKQSVTGTASSMIIKLNRTYGKSLKRMFVTYNNTESANTTYDISTSSLYVDKVQTWYSTINGIRQQDFDLSPTLNFDLIVANDKLNGSVAGSSYQYYTLKWAHFESWDSCKKLIERSHNTDEGLSLAQDLDYAFVASAQASGTWIVYAFAVTQRVLTINKDGVFVDGHF